MGLWGSAGVICVEVDTLSLSVDDVMFLSSIYKALANSEE